MMNSVETECDIIHPLIKSKVNFQSCVVLMEEEIFYFSVV